MSSTNKTTNLELSQFIGSDSPKWLTDYNADMEKIDAGYQTVKAQADATDLIVSGHTSSISTLQDTTTSQGTAITGLRTDVNGNSGSINTINSLIGNGEPTTTDKTIIGAINELDSDVDTLQGKKLVISDHNVTSTETTVSAAMADLYTKLNAVVDELTAGQRIILRNITIAGTRAAYVEPAFQYFTKNATVFGTVNEVAAAECITGNIAIFSDSANNFAKFCSITAAAVTFSDVMSNTISGTSMISYSIIEVA